jgi:hypothetical protein
MNPTSAAIQATVKERFANVAQAPGREKTFPVGPGSAKTLGYDSLEIDALPSSATESFCGVRNPLGVGALRPGQCQSSLARPRSGPFRQFKGSWWPRRRR